MSDIKKMRQEDYLEQPIKDISTNLIKKFYKDLNKDITIVGVGGVDSGKSAFEKITAGANAVQFILEWFTRAQV